MEIGPELIALVSMLILISAIVVGISGFGFALLAVASLAVLLDPRSAVILIGVPSPLLSLRQVHRHWEHRDSLRRLRALLIAGFIGAVVGAQLLVVLPDFVLSIALGAFTLWYVLAAITRAPPGLTAQVERRLAPGVGFLAGVANGTLGASGPILGSYLLAIGLRRTEFVFAIAAMFTTMGIIRVALLVAAGLYTLPTFGFSVALCAPAFAGQWVGFWLQARLSARGFQWVILTVLAAASANLLWRGVSALWTYAI